MTAAYPDNNGEEDVTIREEGTAMHWAAPYRIHGHAIPAGTVAPNNVTLTEEMLEAVDEYVSLVASWDIPVYVEQTLRIDRIYPGMIGTPDVFGIKPMGQYTHLYLGDLKGGYSWVEVFENPQLLCYFVAVMDALGLDDRTTYVKFFICQPRSYHRDGPVREWTILASDLRGLINNLSHSAYLAMSEYAKCVVSPACFNCAARVGCETLQRSSLSAIHFAGAPLPLNLTPAAIGNELRMLKEASKLMEARITGLEAQTEQLLRTGVNVPFFEVRPQTTREQWSSPEAEAQAMTVARMLNKDISKPVRAVTPTQARKVLSSTLVDKFAHRPPGGMKVVPMDAKRNRKTFTPLTSDI